jgi:hypothetical protein
MEEAQIYRTCDKHQSRILRESPLLEEEKKEKIEK